MEFFKKKLLKNKKDKKVNAIFKSLNCINPLFLERIIDLF